MAKKRPSHEAWVRWLGMTRRKTQSTISSGEFMNRTTELFTTPSAVILQAEHNFQNQKGPLLCL